MKKLHLSILTLLMLIISISISEAQKTVAKQSALNYLLKTNRLIGHAHMAVKRGKVYSGDLGNAVRHERLAKKLYNKGNYQRAVVHSRRARQLATAAIKANKVKPTSDANFTPEEDALIGTPPADAELERELTTETEPEVKDEDVINQNNLDIEVK